MAMTGYTGAAPTTTQPDTTTKALIDKVVQLERRISHFVDDSADLGDTNTDTELKETVR